MTITKLLIFNSNAARVKPSLQPYGGNGLIATRHIKKGELLFKEAPFLSILKQHPTSSTHSYCPECWTPTTTPTPFCPSHASSLLSKSYARLLTQEGYNNLRTHQRKKIQETKGKEGGFSAMITDLIGISLMDLVTTGTLNNSSNLMNLLVKGKDMPVEGTPDEWKHDYQEIKKVLLTGKGLSDLFSLKWYTDQMTRLNLNAIQTSYTPSASPTHPIFGTCLYLHTSMMNHSCIPNVSIDWLDETNHIQVFAKSDIEKGGEVLMSYVGDVAESEDPVVVKERWEFFRFNYGFVCGCPLCRR
ncbi:UNVERIFIED_CONTAM: hypothetical protein HDU68_004071 [Siphonaria sp. JEL0065]|nr:hypothetical protein HDU68_004071 [Siphonaria sp. JEL0065]